MTRPAGEQRRDLLSVVIPVYNEVRTIGRVLSQVARAAPVVAKQIIIVDDCSSDCTSEWLRRNLLATAGRWRRLSLDGNGDIQLSAEGASNEGVVAFTVLFHEHNRGKGAALRTGLPRAAGEVVVIQDADLEYDPDDWSHMLPLITERNVADVVYGSRFRGRPHCSFF
jgi:glycosyltransferase involved in cell wall biosynthesis